MGKTDKTPVHSWQIERRKYQNTTAQRRRRARQKEKERLTRLAVKYNLLSADAPSQSQISNDVSKFSYKLILSFFDALFSDVERKNVALIMTYENFSIRDIVKYGLIALGYAMEPKLYNLAENVPFDIWIISILSTFEQNVDPEELVLAGVRTLAQLSSPEDWSEQSSPITSTARENILFGAPRITRISNFPLNTTFFAACLANCQLLGLDPHFVTRDDAISPFWQKSPQDSDDKVGAHHPELGSTTALSRLARLHGFTTNMHPTPEQLTIPHHPYLDIIPWPSFRTRAIVASSMNPPLIDEGDLCLDLFNNGLYCSGMAHISLHGRGEGTPWDFRSWEAKPWFLRKWSLLTSEPDVQQSSAWWRSRI